MSGKEVEIIGILSSSQGKIAVVSALLAGIGYSVLTSITSEELIKSSYLGILFVISSTSVVAGNIFVAIICSMSEQEGEVAHAMSLLRESRQFDLQLEKWWQRFSPLRTRSVWIFYFSVPLLFLAVALLSLIKWPQPFSYLIASLFLIFGGITTQNIFWLSSIFRSDVLLIETFQEVKFNTKLKRVLSSRDSSRYNLGSSVVITPPPTPQEKSQLKSQNCFQFDEPTERVAAKTESLSLSTKENDPFSNHQTTAEEGGQADMENPHVNPQDFQRVPSRKSAKIFSSLDERSEFMETRKGHHSFHILADEESEDHEESAINQQMKQSVNHQGERSITSSKRKKSKKKKNN